VKNPDINVATLITDVSKSAGATLKVTKFIKFNLGEGIEKKVDDFAAEVAKLSGKN
jgi:elongation factor Ts